MRKIILTRLTFICPSNYLAFCRERNSFFRDPDGQFIPNPAPKLSRTPAKADQRSQPIVGGHTKAVLFENGFTDSEIDDLILNNVIEDNSTKSRL